MLVGRRRRLLDYLKAKDQPRYETLIGRLQPAPLRLVLLLALPAIPDPI